MKNSEVVIGEKYIARISGKITLVEVLGKGYPKGWIGKNLATDREVYFKTGGRLRKPVREKNSLLLNSIAR